MALIDVVRTYLEMRSPDALRAAGPPPGPADLRVERRASPDVAEYRALYRAVGEGYHWRDRLQWSDERLAAWLADPQLSLWILIVDGERAGYFELWCDGAEGAVELVYFGLAQPFIGRGLGKFLLTRAVEEAWRLPGTRRVWLHTCTLDDRAALPNYLARGFVETRKEAYVTEI